MKQRLNWRSILLALLLLTCATPSCVGPFRLTSNLNEWNRELDDRWAQEVVFLGLVIIPVYPLSILLDALLFNSLEFWTGSNPIGKDAPTSTP